MTVGRIIDVSSQQHEGGPINWTQVKEAGVTTVLIKATEGTSYTNPYYRSDMLGASAAGLDVLAYHFASFTNAQAEAAYFKSVAGTLACIGDFETSTDVAWMRTFLQALDQPADKVLSYGSASTFVSVYQQLPSLAWVAAYGQLYPGWGVLWQFTDKATVPGIVGDVNESIWHGSEIQYETLFGTYDPPVPPTPPTKEENDTVTVEVIGEFTHVFGIINDVPYHWWQPTAGVGNPPTFPWSVEKLPVA